MQSANQPNIEVVWRPLPGSQELALDSRAHVTLFDGTRGPGKTDCQLMRFRRRVGIGYGSFWRGVIFDREYKSLDDIISKSKRWFPEFEDGAKWLSSKSDYKWVWPTGEELLFREFKDAKTYEKYHGQEFPYIGWNELTKWPNSESFDMMMSCNRSSFTPEKDNPEMPPIPLEVFATTNPSGVGHNWVKRRFIDPAPAGRVVKTETEIYNPATKQKEIVVKKQVRIFGSYRENPYLSPDYIASLQNEKNENRRRAWLNGDWDIVAGGAFDDLWKKSVHVLPRFKVPKTWRIDRSFDWGSSHPFSVGWWAEANGEEVRLPDGRMFAPPPGTLVRIAEWYGSDEPGTNTGKKMSAPDIAEGIKFREEFIKENWIDGEIWPGPADKQIRNVTESDTDTIEKKMADRGVRWADSDKSKGSRMNGLQLARDRLEASLRGEGAGLYVMDNCRAFISLVPTLPRDEINPDDIDTKAEDHIWDETRYRILKGANRMATKIDVSFPR